ncbi:MAG: cytochrome c biogenesis protein CcdA, partial [Acidobacteria bacterium]|nr:cytochrome c biogenesis protein CcdA [Acidobacteriota bacterium]
MLDLASVPLAGFAGMLSILSPCVWPLVPVVMSSAATSGRFGPWYLALGLSTAFAVAGTLLVLLLVTLGLD